ncbi:MAG TPA: RNA polymerase sigma factor SigM [Actinomycetales bacterium]|nr:RNA polymerase sigma factor SigM [Actinomycetales bacterium]
MTTPHQEASDDDLLAAHVAGDPDAFALLVRRHRDRLWAVALRTVGDREEAADALQNALVSAYRRAGTFRGEAAVTTWLHRVVVNACLDGRRRAAARPTTPLHDGYEPADPRDEHAATETGLDVRAALARLPEHQRVALVLVDMQQMSVAEAAAVLEVAEGTVKSRCARGRAALAPLLKPDDGGNHTAATDVPPAGTTSRISTNREQKGGRP